MSSVFDPLIYAFISLFLPFLGFVLFALFSVYFIRKGLIILLQSFSLDKHYGHSFDDDSLSGSFEYFAYSQKKKHFTTNEDIKVLDRETGIYHTVEEVLGESVLAKNPLNHMQMRISQQCERKGLTHSECDDAISTINNRYEFINNKNKNIGDSDVYLSKIKSLSLDGYSSSGLDSRISKRKNRGL